jgi:hypothetical protein
MKIQDGLLHLANANGLIPRELGEQILRDWPDFERAVVYNQVKIAGATMWLAWNTCAA